MGYAVIQIIIFEGIGFLLSESWIGVVTVLKNIGAFFFFLRWWTDDLCLLTYEHVLNTHRQNQRSESNHSTFLHHKLNPDYTMKTFALCSRNILPIYCSV